LSYDYDDPGDDDDEADLHHDDGSLDDDRDDHYRGDDDHRNYDDRGHDDDPGNDDDDRDDHYREPRDLLSTGSDDDYREGDDDRPGRDDHRDDCRSYDGGSYDRGGSHVRSRGSYDGDGSGATEDRSVDLHEDLSGSPRCLPRSRSALDRQRLSQAYRVIEGLVPGPVAAAAIAVLCGARTTREVAAACGWRSTSTAHGYLKQAHAAGLILWDPEKDRTLRPALGLVASSFGR
jgi:hypothetical protein